MAPFITWGIKMTRPCGILDTHYFQDMALIRTTPQLVALLIFLALLALLPVIVSRSILNMIMLMGIWVVAAHGLNILTGYAGQVSIGHAAFVGVGCYTTAVLTTKLGFNFFLTLPLAGLSAGIVGLIFGLPSLRLKGFYLAMATLAAQIIITEAFLSIWPEVLGGSLGISIPPPTIFGFTFATPMSSYYLILTVALIMTFAAKNIVRTRLGRNFVAIRDNDLAAEIMGINVFMTKLKAFFIGCFFAGVAGALWAGFTWSARPDQFPFIQSIWYLGVIIIGGMSSTLGPIFGVIVVRLLNEIALRLTPLIGNIVSAEMAGPIGAGFGLAIFGLVSMLFLIFEPRGVAHSWEIVKERFRNWPFVYPPG